MRCRFDPRQGPDPDELWGVQMKDPTVSERRGKGRAEYRSMAARARRRAKRTARNRGLPLKVFLGKRPNDARAA